MEHCQVKRNVLRNSSRTGNYYVHQSDKGVKYRQHPGNTNQIEKHMGPGRSFRRSVHRYRSQKGGDSCSDIFTQNHSGGHREIYPALKGHGDGDGHGG